VWLPRHGRAANAHRAIGRRGACRQPNGQKAVHDVERAWFRLAVAAGAIVLTAAGARARSPGDPVRLVWQEGDVSGVTGIYGPQGGEPIGTVEYHQTRRGDLLTCVRVARYRDGTEDEDEGVARVAGTLEAVSGHSVVRGPGGEPTAEVTIDVAGGRLQGAWGSGADRQTMDRQLALPRGTYWGPLIFLVVKNFDANAESDRLVFRTVAPSPRPVVLDMELVRSSDAKVERAGTTLETHRLELRLTVHWAVDPLIHLVLPPATFYMLPGDPPALARFAGPRNYARQPIRIE